MAPRPAPDADSLVDLAHIGLGLGILGFQRLQVRRRQFEREYPVESELLRRQVRAFTTAAGALVGVAATVARHALDERR